MNWNHIIFYTINYNKKYNSQVEDYFRKLIKINKFKHRYFYLYEVTKSFPSNIFFAYEGNVDLKVPTIPSFFECYKLVRNSSEPDNGEYFLTVLSAICKAHLAGELFKQQKNRTKGLLHLNHIIHCMLNLHKGSRKEELDYYLEQVKFYGNMNFE